MKPENTKSQAKQKKEAVRGLISFVLMQIFFAVLLGCLGLIPVLPRWGAILFYVLSALCIALILPALWALKVRFHEIKGGEIDAARHY